MRPRCRACSAVAAATRARAAHTASASSTCDSRRRVEGGASFEKALSSMLLRWSFECWRLSGPGTWHRVVQVSQAGGWSTVLVYVSHSRCPDSRGVGSTMIRIGTVSGPRCVSVPASPRWSSRSCTAAAEPWADERCHRRRRTSRRRRPQTVCATRQTRKQPLLILPLVGRPAAQLRKSPAPELEP